LALAPFLITGNHILSLGACTNFFVLPIKGSIALQAIFTLTPGAV
jgi:hypothetical protein